MPQQLADRSVKGKILDESGGGLPGVSVVLKGTQRGTSSGSGGEFTLDIPEGGAKRACFQFCRLQIAGSGCWKPVRHEGNNGA
jgi:hypothetical protein